MKKELIFVDGTVSTGKTTYLQSSKLKGYDLFVLADDVLLPLIKKNFKLINKGAFDRRLNSTIMEMCFDKIRNIIKYMKYNISDKVCVDRSFYSVLLFQIIYPYYKNVTTKKVTYRNFQRFVKLNNTLTSKFLVADIRVKYKFFHIEKSWMADQTILKFKEFNDNRAKTPYSANDIKLMDDIYKTLSDDNENHFSRIQDLYDFVETVVNNYE